MSREQDQVFIRNFLGILGLLVAVTIVLIVIATSLFEGDEAEQAQLARERAQQRLAPVAAVRLSGEPMPEIAKAADSGGGSGEPRGGEEVVQAVCIACHQGNFQNAPALGDKAAWEPRIQAGLETLVEHVKNGYGNMPAQGGAASDEEIRAAIQWMVEEETGLKLAAK